MPFSFITGSSGFPLFFLLPIESFETKKIMPSLACNRCLSRSSSYKVKGQELSDEEDYSFGDIENGMYQQHENKEENTLALNQTTGLVPFLRGWFSYSRLVSPVGTSHKSKSCLTRYTCDFLSSFKRIIEIYGCGHYSRRETWREE